jgi:hypothetical protein
MAPQNLSTLLLSLSPGSPDISTDTIRRSISEVNPDIITAGSISLVELSISFLAAEHFAYSMLKGLTAIALGITAVGLYSIISFALGSTVMGVRMLVSKARPNRCFNGSNLAARIFVFLDTSDGFVAIRNSGPRSDNILLCRFLHVYFDVFSLLDSGFSCRPT